MKDIALAPLGDRRLQIWAVDDDGALLSSRKVNVGADADWTDLTDLVADIGPLPAAAAHVAAAPLSDGRVELWVSLVDGRLFSAWQTSFDTNATWSAWHDFLAEVGPLPGGVTGMAVAALPDARLQLWVATSNGGLFSTWKVQVDPNAAWSGWNDFFAEAGALSSSITSLAVAPLSDGRLELWAATSAGGLFSSWMVHTDPNANWTAWADFLAEVGPLPAAATRVAVAPLQDERLELWAATSAGGLFTTWKVDTDANAEWSPWSDFLAEVGPLPSAAVAVAVAPLSDGRLELWAADAEAGLFTTWKIGPDPNASWSPWNDFLTETRTTPNWAVVLCNLSDVAPGPDARARYVQFFTSVGTGSGGAFDYWRDISYGRGGLRASRVFGFIDIGRTRAELNAFSGGAQRQKIWDWGRAAAQSNGIDLAAYSHTIIFLNVSADHGGVGGGVVLAYEDTRPLEPTFIAHEMGHGFGLDHSFGESSTPCASGDGRPGAYCDMFDIMSAMNVHSFQDALNRRCGPSLNALSRERMGWMPSERVWSTAAPLRAESVTLAALNRADVPGHLMAKLSAPSRDPNQAMPSTYVVEYKDAAGWDRGLIHDHVYIHEVRVDGLVRLLTDFHGGLLDQAPNTEFVTPGGTAVVRLRRIDPILKQAELRIWKPGPGPRRLRLEAIDYDPPGADLPNEFVLITNDTSASIDMGGWTLRDVANHVFQFPAFVLEAGFSVRIWTRAGANDPQNLFWGRGMPMWNNRGDTAILRNGAGVEIDRMAY
jgi:hypothetical protein